MRKLNVAPFPVKWSTTKAILVGWLSGRGNQSPDIARALNDGTTPETIRWMLQRSNLEQFGRDRNIVYVAVRLTAYERKVLGRRAQKRGMSLDQWLRNVAVNAGIPDDLYDGIVPDES